MWRNIFGHAIYQMTVLLLIVFLGPGWLCQDYWTKCVKYENGKCKVWNPFYTDQVYQTDVTIKWWKDKGLKAADFEQNELKIMNCLHKNKLLNCDTYWSGLDKSKIYTPNDFERFDETQKLMHYTFVF